MQKSQILFVKSFCLTLVLIFSIVAKQNLCAQNDKKTKPDSKAVVQLPNSSIVPNPGFEKYASTPIGWFYKGAHFNQVMKYWYSVTTSSPDVYGPLVKVPVDWAEKGFGKQTAHGGKSMIGLTSYGCVNGKPHCREYVQIQLAEPLVKGQWYHVEFWTTHLELSLQINRLGAYFSMGKIERKTDEVIVRSPQIYAPKPIAAEKGKWVKVSGKFKANDAFEYLSIGNFFSDDSTATKAYRKDCYPYAYYYIDDVLVKKIPPYLKVPVPPDDLLKNPLRLFDTVALKNIYFEFDKDELMPRSYIELNKLLKIMRDRPAMCIEIAGHTDSDGDDDYNLDLSKRRAKAVVNFLVENKILPSRLKSRGEGERKPIDTNETEEGRAINRRVEFVIQKK